MRRHKQKAACVLEEGGVASVISCWESRRTTHHSWLSWCSCALHAARNNKPHDPDALQTCRGVRVLLSWQGRQREKTGSTW